MTNREYETVSTVMRVLAKTLGIAPSRYAVTIIAANGPYINASVRGTTYTICGEELTGIFSDKAIYIPVNYETEER